MANTTIEWTELTWNPTTGCDKVSQGCKFCYAEVMTKRLNAMGVEKYADGFKVRVHPRTLEDPFKWKKPSLVFVNSMSDLFHEEVPLPFIKKVFQVMNKTPQHTYQILTKRAERAAALAPHLNWAANIWMGVSVEDMKVADRVKYLRQIPATVRFLSAEPLLGSLSLLDLSEIDWLIAGGESGRKCRPMEKIWVEELQAKCEAAGTAFFFKQWGGINKKKAGRTLNGKTYDALPIPAAAGTR